MSVILSGQMMQQQLVSGYATVWCDCCRRCCMNHFISLCIHTNYIHRC